MFAIRNLFKVLFVSVSAISVSSETITAGTFYDVSFENGDAEIPSLEQLRVLNECEAQSSCIHIVKLKKTGKLKKISSTKDLEELRNQGDIDGFMTKTLSKKLVNVAFKKIKMAYPVSQLSSSSVAVDGKRDGPCYFTSTELPLPWWRVAFGKVVFVHTVSATSYLKDIDIRVGYQDKNGVNPYCRRNVSIAKQTTKEFECEGNAVGTYLFIEKRSPVLFICEVEVYGILLD